MSSRIIVGVTGHGMGTTGVGHGLRLQSAWKHPSPADCLLWKPEGKHLSAGHVAVQLRDPRFFRRLRDLRQHNTENDGRGNEVEGHIIHLRLFQEVGDWWRRSPQRRCKRHPPSLLPERALQLPTTGAASTGVAMEMAPWTRAN